MSEGLSARAAAADVKVAEAELEAVGLWPNPTTELSREANAAGVRAGESQDRLLVSLPLVLSGRLGLQRDAARSDVEAAQARLAHARGTLRHEATEAFLAALGARRRVEVHRQSLTFLDEIVAAIVARERAGQAAGYDRVRIELETERLVGQLTAAVSEEARTLARVRSFLAPPADEVRLAERELSQDLLGERDLSRADVEQRGDVRALSLEADAAKLREDAAWRSLIPDPTLFGGGSLLDVGGPELGFGYAIGVEVPLPVFDRGQGDRARARARGAVADSRRAALVQAARARLVAAVSEREARVERSRHHDEQVLRRADELLEITSAAYQGGAADLLALVDAARAHQEARVTSVELRLASRLSENDALLLAGAYDDVAPGSAP